MSKNFVVFVSKKKPSQNYALFLQNRIKGILDQYTVFDTVLMVRCIALGLRMAPLDCGLTQLENHTAFGDALKLMQTHKLRTFL